MNNFFFFVVAAGAIWHAGYGQALSPSVYAWSPTGPLANARHSACVAALDDGRGLVAGGEGATGLLKSVELYQLDGHFIAAAPLLHARSNHTCTVLADGRVLAAGGKGDRSAARPRSADDTDEENDGASAEFNVSSSLRRPGYRSPGAAPAEIYDPATNTWTDLATPGIPRWNQTATLLADGSVLLAGGETSSGATGELEIFNPLTNRIELVAAKLSVPRTNHAAAPLRDGRVLIIGGTDGRNLFSSIDVYNPDGTVSHELQLPEPRAGHSATTLDDGRVLIAGGQGAKGDLNSAVLYSPDDNVFRSAGPLMLARTRHLAFLIPGNGSVLVAGGISMGAPTTSSEVFDPKTGSFSAAGSLTAPRFNLAGAALNRPGVVLAVGGLSSADQPLATCGAFLTPAVTLNKSSYVQGNNITVSGANWPAGITLTINAVVTTFQGTISINQFFNVTVSSTGAFQMANALAAPLGVETSGGLITASTFATLTVNGSTMNFHASAGATQLDVTTTSFAATPEKVLTQESVRLAANVRMGLPAFPLQGTVRFFDGRTLLGTVSTSATAASPPGSTYTSDVNGNNFFTLPQVILSAGTRDLHAVFSPDTTLLASSENSAQVTVEKRPTVMTFTVSPTTSVTVGRTLTLSATVKPSDTSSAIPVLPTGAVQVFRNPIPSFIPVNLSPNSSTGSSSGSTGISAGPAGSLSLTAGYFPGDDNYQASATTTVSVAIGKGSVVLTLTPNPISAPVGGLINLTANIQHPAAAGSPATGTLTILNGPANFSSNTVTVSPDFNNGSTVSTPMQTFIQDAGSETIQVHYSGNDNYLAADVQVPATVTKAVPDIVISNFNPVCCQIPFTFHVDVNPPGSLFAPKSPTGLFDTLANGLGELGLLGDCVLSPNANGRTASCNPMGAMTSGNLTSCTMNIDFTFTYHGDSNYQSKKVTITKAVPIVNCVL